MPKYRGAPRDWPKGQHPWNVGYFEYENKPRADHPGRCRHNNSRTGKQCTQWALLGLRYCRTHEALHCSSSRRSFYRWRKGWDAVMTDFYYENVLGARLKERMRLAAEQAEKEVKLVEELAIVRAAATESLSIASQVLEAEGMTPKQRAGAVSLIMESMRQVADMSERVVRLRRDNSVAITFKQVDGIIKDLLVVVRDELSENDEERKIAQRIVDRLSGETTAIHSAAQGVTVNVEFGD